METSIYLALLRREVERQFGRALCSPTDFAEASEEISRVTRVLLSVSTLKRLWGYVESKHRPRLSTLSALAKYLGMRDWTQFCLEADVRLLPDSGFLGDDVATVSEIATGQRLRLQWAPDRMVEVTCTGEGRFRVDMSENAKLQAGMEFSASLMAVGFPLQAYDVTPAPAEGLTVYVAAARGGLTAVERI